MTSKRTSVAFDDFSATYCRGKFIIWYTTWQIFEKFLGLFVAWNESLTLKNLSFVKKLKTNCKYGLSIQTVYFR